MTDLKKAMKAVDNTAELENAVDNNNRVKELYNHQKRLPSLRKDALVRTFEKELDKIRNEITHRQAEALMRLEKIDDEESVNTDMILAAIHEAEQERKDVAAKWDRCISSLRNDIKDIRRAANERRSTIKSAHQSEDESAKSMLKMLELAIGAADKEIKK